MKVNTSDSTRTEYDPKEATYIPDRRLRTAEAAARAVEICEAVEGTNKAEVPENESELFIAIHVCAYRAARPNRGREIKAPERNLWARRYRTLRDYAVERNLGLAYSMIRRFKCHENDHDDMVSDALFSLARAVEKFNPWQGYRFSTYACTAVARALINRSKRGLSYRRRFPFRHELSYEMSERVDTQTELYAERLHRALDQNFADLNELESLILAERFPMDYKPQSTLGAIGKSIGLSKERVRQIQNSALQKLREVLDADPALY